MRVDALPYRFGCSWALVASLAVSAPAFAQSDPLPSWNDGPAEKAIVAFVRATTDKSSPKFVPPSERIATFDQDGTLWVSHPMYAQVVYCLDRVPAVVKASRSSRRSSRSRPCCPATARRWRGSR